MSINLAELTPRVRATRKQKTDENGQAIARNRQPRTVYVVRDNQGGVLLCTRDKGAADKLKDATKGATLNEYGSRASLPPAVVLKIWKANQDLAKFNLATGGKFGAESQNAQTQKSLAYILKETFDTVNKARAMEKKELLPIPSVEAGEWQTVKATTEGMTQAEIAELSDLEF